MVVDKNNIIFEMEKLIFIQALRKILVQVLPLININLDKEFSVKSEHPLDISPFSFTYAWIVSLGQFEISIQWNGPYRPLALESLLHHMGGLQASQN